MKEITIKISTLNDAFDGDEKPELARILSKIASEIKDGGRPSAILDINGQLVGRVSYK